MSMSSIHSILFFSATLRLESAMSIGTGEKNAVVCDRDGCPYIPAASLAGVLRHSMSKEDGDALFGRISLKRGHNEAPIPSKIIVENGWLCSTFSYAFRECVGLGENRTALSGAKYSILTVDRGAKFRVRFEFEFASEAEERRLFGDFRNSKAPVSGAFIEALARMNKGEITLGRKSSRGLGRVAVETCKWKRYAGDTLLNSIEHDPEKDEDPFTLPEPMQEALRYIRLDYNVCLRSTLCIREYVSVHHTLAQLNEEPNYMQLTSGGLPVIPGMSWAGVFRHGALNVLRRLNVSEERSKVLCDELFGSIGADKHASNVRFSDTFLEDYKTIRSRRTAVNRFSGGAANRALYAEDFVTAGKDSPCGRLTILVKKNLDCTKWGMDLIHLLMHELDAGRLHVGGNGAIGRGLFSVENLKDSEYKNLAGLIRSEQERSVEGSEHR